MPLTQSGEELGMAVQDSMAHLFEDMAEMGLDPLVHSVMWSPIEDRMVIALLCVDGEGSVRLIRLVSGEVAI